MHNDSKGILLTRDDISHDPIRHGQLQTLGDLPKLCRPPFLAELGHDRLREIDVGRSLDELLGIGWNSLYIDSRSLELLVYCDLRTDLVPIVMRYIEKFVI
jgi:hypothetical protein